MQENTIKLREGKIPKGQTVRAFLNFSGYYYTYLYQAIEDALTMEIEAISQEEGKELTTDDINLDNYSEVCREIAEKYARDYWPAWIHKATAGAASEDFSIEFVKLWQPYDYFQGPDDIEVKISFDLIRQVRRWIRDHYEAEFEAYVRDRCTSRDGFISFLDNNVYLWSALNTWKPCQYEIMFDFIEKLWTGIDYEWSCDLGFCEDFSDSIYSIVSSHLKRLDSEEA